MMNSSKHLTRTGLTVEQLLAAYRSGAFPMAMRWEDAPDALPDGGPGDAFIAWFSPDPRGIIDLDDFHVPQSLQRVVRHHDLAITSDRAFVDVMRACAEPRKHEQLTWISDELIEAYCGLHERGFAHSIEAWRRVDDGGDTERTPQLVGGLYGVHIGGAFFGESMFVRPDLGGTNASKVCLVHLVAWLRSRGFVLLDTQFWNEHLAQFGCVEIPKQAYLERLARAVDLDVTWGAFEPVAVADTSRERG